jgi:hypothetical protein
MDFAGGEARFGPLVSSDGMNYDDAAMRAWEAGFFPDHVDRPTVDEFLDALGGTHSGRDRAFRPDDLGEVEAFEKARSQRWDVESARERGAPMVEDRGQPIGLDDLEANAPPVRAYEEWGENAPDFAGNLRLDKLDSPQAIKRALVAAHQRVGGFDAATRGRITQAETANLASDLGMTADDLLKRRKGQAFNAEEALAARQIVARSATDLVNLAKRMQRADNPGDDLEKAFAAAWLRHVAIQEQVAGVTAEAGRVLAQFRMAASSGATNRVLPSFDMVTGGPSRLKDAARLIVDTAADPAAVNANAARLLKPRFRDKLVELYYNSLLSGPQTHAVNVLSNVITSVTQIPEHLAAAGVGVVRQAAGRQRANPDRVLFAEVGARAVGLLQGTREGMREAARTFRTGDPSDAISKVEGMSQRAISGVKGSIIRTPSRALSAEDELFKAMARRMELTGLAVRQATTEGLRGEAGKARIAELVANPPDAMLGRSLDYARYLTFQTPLEHGSISQSISLFAQKHPLVKLLVPFVRTPVNILKYAGERSPAAPLLKDWRAQFRAGGADRDLAVAKMMVGSGLMASVASFAGEGSMTGGGPADESAKRLLRADGWQPYSFRVGDKFYSYQRLDPLATTLGVAADFAELQSHMTVKQREHVAMMLTSATIKNLSNKVWFSGVTDLSNAITDSQRYGGGFLRRMAGSLTVPTGVAQVARTIDPTLRETRTFLDAVRARIPVASKSLFPRRDVWGRPVEREGGLGPDLVSPVWTGTARNDPVNSELLAAGARIGALQRRDYTPEQFDRYQEVAGSLAYTGMQSLIGSGEWTGASLPDRADMAETVVRDARREAREVVGASVGGSDPWTEFQDAR